MKLLVIRFSAMGDVAMASPVVRTILSHSNEVEIHFLSRPFFEPLFETTDRFRFFGADLRERHKGLPGLYRLHQDLMREKYDAVIDLHDSLRSNILNLLFRLRGISVYQIDKGRKEKKLLLSRGARCCKPLMHSAQRYLTVFRSIGINPDFSNLGYPDLGAESHAVTDLIEQKKGGKKWVGIAPFAAHESKEWTLDKMALLAEKLRVMNFQLLWFGAGQRELGILEEKLMHSEKDICIAGNFELGEELSLMKQLEVMVCMDSANMHMAAISGVRVVSIWGPTHPYAGFWPLRNRDGIVQADISCRPCTIYGKLSNSKARDCARKSMDQISVKMVLDKIMGVLQA